MALAGPDFYDDEELFISYTRRRQRTESPNNTLELPVILALTLPVAGQRVLDLGCGDAAIGRIFFQEGATHYLGIEGSHRMAALATQTLLGSSGEVIVQRLEEWAAPSAAFDLVLSRLVFHYIENLEALFANVAATLTPGGRFVFSIEHPVITSSDRGWQAGTPRQDWLVDDYFCTGLRVNSWLGGTVIKYHRTIEQYFHLLQKAGFRIDALREAHPQREHFVDQETFAHRQRIPLFLILAAHKPV